MIGMRRGSLIAGCVLVLSFAACGDDGGDATTSTGITSGDQLKTLESTLRNAATAQETYAAENFVYATSVTELESSGLNVSTGQTLEVVTATETSYCLEASVDDVVMHLDSATQTPGEGSC